MYFPFRVDLDNSSTEDEWYLLLTSNTPSLNDARGTANSQLTKQQQDTGVCLWGIGPYRPLHSNYHTMAKGFVYLTKFWLLIIG